MKTRNKCEEIGGGEGSFEVDANLERERGLDHHILER